MASISVPDDSSDLDMISDAPSQHGAIFRLQNGRGQHDHRQFGQRGVVVQAAEETPSHSSQAF